MISKERCPVSQTPLGAESVFKPPGLRAEDDLTVNFL